jgi:small subunit ribosomal protein S5
MEENKNAQENVLVEKVIQIDRINKVVSGGKRMAFRAFVISGDLKGRVGIGLGKSKEVPNSIRKAVEKAKKGLKIINMLGDTLPHEVSGEYGASRVILKPARPGTGIIAGGAVRIILEAAGFKNVVAKAFSKNSINLAKATMEALTSCRNLEEEAKLRGKVLNLRSVKG